MLARCTGLMDRSISVNIQSKALGAAELNLDLDLDLAGGGFLDIRCVLSDMDLVVCEESQIGELFGVACVE